MPDKVSTATRSRMMAAVKRRDTAPEVLVRRYLHAVGFRFRSNDSRLPGSPDVVLPKYRIVIFVHGCFWHRHEQCRFAAVPATRTDFWKAKFERNVERDRRNMADLAELGWTVMVIWECELANPEALDQLAWRIIAAGPA